MRESDKNWDDIQEPETLEEVNEQAEDAAEDAQKAFSTDEFTASGEEDIQLNFESTEEPEAREEAVSESAIYVNKAKQLLQDYQDAQKQKTRLVNEVKQCEKSVASNEKIVADSIAIAIKKRKEEISSSYDKELSGIQDNIDATKAERQKAKNNAIAMRIQNETAPINQENQELEGQIEQKFRENKVPAICRSQGFLALFSPHNLKDWISCAIAAVLFVFLIPLFIILAMTEHPLGLAIILFIYLVVIGGLYLYILHKFVIKNTGTLEEVNELRSTIRNNNKSKQAISNRIKKSQDEALYHLEEYDNEINRLQGQMEETVNQRQAALDLFESDVRHQITAEVTAEKEEATQAVEQRLEDARKAQMTLDNEIEAMETTIREEYEPLFGKDLLHRSKLDSLSQFCEEHADLSVEEAVGQYRSR